MSDSSFDPVAIATKTKLKGSFYFFARYAFKQTTGSMWHRNWHHGVVCNALEDVFHGKIKRLIINIPPRYSKTELAMVNFVPWCLANVPDCEFIHASYSARLAANNSFRSRNIVESDWYQDFFPETMLLDGSNAKDDWKTSAGGVVYATGAYGTITGFGAGKMREGFAGAIIIDDPHKADEANSDVRRANVIDWYQNTIQSRVNSPDTPIIIIMQRLHEDDLTGWLLKGGSGEKWHHICIPARNDAGEPLWAEKHSEEALKVLEATNSYVFAGQYMQRPSPLGGGIFKNDWWQFFHMEDLPRASRIIQSWDTAFKAKDSNDYSVCTTWADCGSGTYYLLDRFKGKVEYPELKRIAKSLAAKYKPNAVLVEDKASGQSLIQELQRETDIPVVPVKVDSDKVSRAFAVTPLVEGKRVFLPHGAPWVQDFIHTLASFPNASHDDDVDSATQALNYLARGGGENGFLEYLDWIEKERKEKEKEKEEELAA